MGLGLREIRCSGEPLVDNENGEELMRVQPGVGIALADLPCESPGTLYITNKQVIWVNDVDRSKGYAVDFLSISLHAISRDPDTYPLHCLYTQIDIEEADEDHSDSDSNHIQQDLSNISEMRLIPSDPTQLDALFETFCRCAELNPEPNDEVEEEHNWIFSADQMEDEEAEDEGYLSHNPANTIGQSNGDHDLARTVLELQIDDRRFEDAEEMEDNGDGTHH